MAKCEKILISGFSGAGKTSFIRELEFSCPNSAWTFSDLDQLILKGQGAEEVSLLIDTHGWDQFRRWERQSLEGWLKEDGSGVLSLGGGTLSQAIYDLYQPSRKIGFLYLHASFEDCWERLHLESTEARPLIKLGKDGLHRVYEERLKVFSQIPWRLDNPKGGNLGLLAKRFWEQVYPS